ncbi:MAG: DedA family protein [Chlorobiales bacterium]|nr:DedA family protein [Chlorobiales bacterium]
MLESIIAYVQTLDSTTIYLFLFIIAYLENVIPPIPGDVPVAFVGYLLALDGLSFTACVAASSLGSLGGFMTAYFIGRVIGFNIYVEEGSKLKRKIARAAHKMFPPEQMDKFRDRFSHYGYGIILINRFLTGTRAIISVTAGIMHLNWFYVLITALVGAVIWNVLLIGGGYLLGDNWREIGGYISTYGTIITILVMIGIGLLINRHIKSRRETNQDTDKI